MRWKLGATGIEACKGKQNSGCNIPAVSYSDLEAVDGLGGVRERDDLGRKIFVASS